MGCITMANIIKIIRIASILPAIIIACIIAYDLFLMEPWPFGPYLLIALMFLSLLLFWLAMRGQFSRDLILILFGFLFGFIFGFIGLLCGVFGAIYLYPDSNLAPILGFLQTAPIGFCSGTIFGIMVGVFFTSVRGCTSDILLSPKE